MMSKIEIFPEAVEKVKNFKIDATVPLGFGKFMSPIMVQAIWKNGEWSHLKLMPYGPISLDPCTKVFHYAQEIFEGMKAFMHSNNQVALFRPEANAERFNLSAKRMCMPEIPVEMFVQATEVISAYSKNIIPKRFGESLYLRPFMIATEVGLGIKPSNEFLFVVVASPSGNYFSGSSVKVLIERNLVRAVNGGTGFAKTGGNYAGSLLSYKKTNDQGCDQTMWLDSVHHRYIEEMSGMNFFAVIDNVLVTPEISETILDGITRKSIIEIARSNQIEVKETKIDINELLEMVKNKKCTEAFVCGTASILAPIHSFKDADGTVVDLSQPEGKISLDLRDKLVQIQVGRQSAPQGWIHFVKEIEF